MRHPILKSRFLRPFLHLFGHPALWSASRRSVPRALAVGLFAGFIVPFGQFLLAALLAVPARANVPIAASATLVTNPFTFAPIYFAAYKVGTVILRPDVTGDVGSVAQGVGQKLLQVSGPTAVGLLTFAITGAMLGYAGGALWWRLRLLRKWRRRLRRSD